MQQFHLSFQKLLMVNGVYGQPGTIVANHVGLVVISDTEHVVILPQLMEEKNVLETLLINDHVITTLAVSNH